MDSIEATVKELELELLQPATRASAQRLDLLLADDFLEVGAAGQIFGKAHVLARLPSESGIGFVASLKCVVVTMHQLTGSRVAGWLNSGVSRC